MSWIALLLPLLLQLLTWLINRNKPLNEHQKRRLNILIARFHKVEAIAVTLGAKVGGEDGVDDSESSHANGE